MTNPMICQVLADLRAALARLETALGADSPAIPAAPARLQSGQAEAMLVFEALQDRLAAMEHWPVVQYQPWLNEDELSRVPLGQPIGDGFTAGWASVCLELEQDTTPWLVSVVLLDVSVPLAALLESLPGLLVLLADEAVGARLARDGWVIPPVLLPLLAQIPLSDNGA